MATILNQYREKQSIICSQISENSMLVEDLLGMQELNYRICVLETFQAFCQSAPITLDTHVMAYHFQLMDAYIGFIQKERKFGLKTDEEGKRKRETAHVSLQTVIQNGRKCFSSFAAVTQEQYKSCVKQYINTILPVWIQYRNTYVNINL